MSTVNLSKNDVTFYAPEMTSRGGVTGVYGAKGLEATQFVRLQVQKPGQIFWEDSQWALPGERYRIAFTNFSGQRREDIPLRVVEPERKQLQIPGLILGFTLGIIALLILQRII